MIESISIGYWIDLDHLIRLKQENKKSRRKSFFAIEISI